MCERQRYWNQKEIKSDLKLCEICNVEFVHCIIKMIVDQGIFQLCIIAITNISLISRVHHARENMPAVYKALQKK